MTIMTPCDPEMVLLALARIMAQVGDAEVSVEIFKKAESEARTEAKA